MVKSSFLVAKMPRTCPSRCPVARMKPRVGPWPWHQNGPRMTRQHATAGCATVKRWMSPDLVTWVMVGSIFLVVLLVSVSAEMGRWRAVVSKQGRFVGCVLLWNKSPASAIFDSCPSIEFYFHTRTAQFIFKISKCSLRMLMFPLPCLSSHPPSFQHPRYRNYILGSSPLQLHFIQSDPKMWQDFCPSISISNTRSTSSTSGRLLCGLFPTSLQHSTAGAPCKSQGTASPCAVAWHSAFAEPGPATSPVLGPRGAGAAASHVATSGAVGLQAAANAPAATVGGWGGGTAPAAASHTGARQVESNAWWVQWQQAPHGCWEIDGWGEREHHREEGGAKGRRTPPEPLAATHDRLQPAFHSIAPEITSCVHRAHQAAARRVVATTSTTNFFGTKTTDAKTNWRPSRAENSHDSPIGRFRSYKPHIHRCRTWKVQVQVTTRKRAITLGIPDDHTWHTWHTWTRALQSQGHKARQQPGFRSPIFKIQMTSDDMSFCQKPPKILRFCQFLSDLSGLPSLKLKLCRCTEPKRANDGRSETKLEIRNGMTKKDQGFGMIHLVGGLEHLLFFHILGMSSSQLTNSYFSEG